MADISDDRRTNQIFGMVVGRIKSARRRWSQRHRDRGQGGICCAEIVNGAIRCVESLDVVKAIWDCMHLDDLFAVIVGQTLNLGTAIQWLGPK